MKRSKLLSLLLALCMVLSLLPAVAVADTSVTDVLDRSFTGVSGTTYTEWSEKTSNSNAVYAGQSAGQYDTIQLRSNNSNSGIITTASGGKVKTITVAWNSNSASGRTLDVYGKNTAYTQAADLYNDSNKGTKIGSIVCGTSTELTIEGDYTYIGLRSNSGAMYIDKIEITWNTEGGTPDPDPDPDPEPSTDPWKLRRVPQTGDVVVIYYPTASKVMTGEVYNYQNASGTTNKNELVSANATLTGEELSVPSNALLLTVSVDENSKYTFATSDNRYLESDGNDLQLATEQSANTLFTLETAAAGTDNYYIKCDSAEKYIEYYSKYFTVYDMSMTNSGIFTFQFFSQNGEGPTPEVLYTVTLKPGIDGIEPIIDNEAHKAYKLPETCPFPAPEGKEFDQWVIEGTETKYNAGDSVTLEGNTVFVATWKDLPVVETKTYKKVTSEPTDWSGEYLIVYEAGSVVLDASLDNLNKNPNTFAVTIGADKTIETENTHAFTINKADDGYTVLSSSGYYFNHTTDSNGLTFSDTDSNPVTISFVSADDISIVGSAGAHLRYNNSAKLFRFYKSSTYTSQKEIALYKLDEGSEPEEPTATEPEYTGQQLVLSGKIGLRFNVNLPEIEGVDYTNSYMTFSVQNGTATERVDYADSVLNDNKTRGFTCYLNSIQMAEKVTATFHYTKDNAVVTLENNPYSIEDYFRTFESYVEDGIFSNTEANTKMIALVHAVEDYGYYMQRFLSDKNKWELGTAYAEQTVRYAESFDTDINTIEEEKRFSKTITGTDIEAITYSLALDSETDIRVYIKPAAGYTGSLTVSVDGGAAYAPDLVSGRYLVTIPKISAHLLSTTHTIAVTTDNGGANVSVCAISYVYSMLVKYASEEVSTNAAGALYAYSQAADAYYPYMQD